jgi:hypothetical protein
VFSCLAGQETSCPLPGTAALEIVTSALAVTAIFGMMLLTKLLHQVAVHLCVVDRLTARSAVRRAVTLLRDRWSAVAAAWLVQAQCGLLLAVVATILVVPVTLAILHLGPDALYLGDSRTVFLVFAGEAVVLGGAVGVAQTVYWTAICDRLLQT